MANRFTFPRETAFDANGAPLAGALLHFYEAGTTKPAAVYTDPALTAPAANPMVADSAGRFGDIFLQAIDYKVVLADADGVTVWTADPVSGTLDARGDDFAPSQQSPADMTVLVAAGSLFDLAGGAIVARPAQTTPLIAAPAANPRIDIVHVDRATGLVGVATGAEAVAPADPAIPEGALPVARVTLTPATAELTAAEIADIRELANIGAGGAAARNTGAAAGQIAVNDQPFADVASAATAAIGAAPSHNVLITGTAAISAFDAAAAGLRRRLRFEGALTLAHDPASLILPGGADIVTGAGDTAEFVSLGGGDWLCVAYQKADGLAVKDRRYLFTETADVPFSTTVPAGTPWSAPKTVVIPSSGFLRLTFTGRCDNGDTVTIGVHLGLRINGTDYWPTRDANGALQYMQMVRTPASGYAVQAGFLAPDSGNIGIPLVAHLPVEALAIPVGLLTIQPIIARSGGTATHTLKGTLVPARLYMEILNFG